MALTKRQRQLDLRKWFKSEREEKDACGSFYYCEFCDKQKENPCDKAYRAYYKNKKSAK